MMDEPAHEAARSSGLALDETGAWLDGARHAPSPNFDARPADALVDLLVVHGISLPPGRFGTPHVEDLFCNRLDPRADPYFAAIATLRVSAHAVITRDGATTQYVPFTMRAWHAGVSRFEGRDRCNDYSIGIELEGCDDIPYTTPQYRSLSRLCALLMRRWPAIALNRIVGHCDVAPGRKTDPGPAFDWTRLRSEVRSRLGDPPPRCRSSPPERQSGA